MPALTTVYFDGSLGITDANNAWTNDANAFNGDTIAFATAGGTQSPTSGALVGAGTSGSISSGSTILSVRARLYGGNPTTRTWGSWVTLTAPTGGWTSANIKSLETRIYNDLTPSWTARVKARITTAGNAENLGTVEAGTDSASAADGANVGRVEIEVSTDTGQRYLRATGNWNGPVWADTSAGVAGSAATPTVGNSVYMQTNHTVTLDQNIQVEFLYIYDGVFRAENYNVTTDAHCSISTFTGGSPTVYMGSGTWETRRKHYGAPTPAFSVSADAALYPESSLLLLHSSSKSSGDNPVFLSGSHTYNDVHILLDKITSSTYNITGSPTFRSLIIQSKNSAAHTVQFDAGATITATDEFVASGTTSNNLSLRSSTSGTKYTLTSANDQELNEYLDIKDSTVTGGGNWIANDSLDSGNNTGWSFIDRNAPPSANFLLFFLGGD